MFKILKFQLSLFHKYSKSFILINIIMQLLSSIAPLLGVVLSKFLIDELTYGQNIEKVIILTTSIIMLTFGSSMIMHYLKHKVLISTNSVFNAFQVELVKKISILDLQELETKEYQEIQANAFKFLYGGGRGFGSIGQDLFSLLGKIITLVGVIGIISTLNIFIVLIFIILIILLSIQDVRAKNKIVEIDFEKIPYERKTVYFLELISKFEFGKEMRVYNLRDWISNKYKEHLQITQFFYKKSSKIATSTGYLSSFTQLIKNIVSYSFLIFYYLTENMTIGSFTMYLTAITTFTETLSSIMSSIANINTFIPYFNAVEKFMDLPTNLRSSATQDLEKQDTYTLEFKNVYFKYKNAENYTLEDISTKIEFGKNYSIVGENGAGKTTFIKLILRMYDVTKGEILLNGVNIKKIDYDQYMSLFSVAFQDFKLLAFTIAENIVVSDINDNNRKETESILSQIGFDKKLQSLSNGVDTSIYKTFDSSGFEPSGGEGQKIALSRALYKNAPIMILDEPTSALDPRAEYEMYKDYNNYVNTNTVIFISHRLSSTKFSDSILVFKDKKIYEEGNHSSLMKKSGYYKELYDMQAQFYID